MRNCCGFWWGRKQNTVNHDGNEIDTLRYVWKSALRTMIFSMVEIMKRSKGNQVYMRSVCIYDIVYWKIDFAVC